MCRRACKRRRRSGLLVHALEHAVHGVISKRPDRAAQRPPQRLPPPFRDQVGHLHLVKPQPHERVRGGRQLLQLTGSLADHRDHLPPRIHPRHRGRQQLRRPRPGGHVEGDQRPVPVRRQPGEDLVELPVRNAARDPGWAPAAGRARCARRRRAPSDCGERAPARPAGTCPAGTG